VEKTFAWQLSATGNYYWDAYTSLPSDENTANDTATAAYVTVTPIHSYELGYDARQYTLPNATFFYWSFDPGDGALVRFVPADHSLPEAIDIVQAKMLFYSTGPCNLTVFDEGTATQPGAEIYTTAVTVNQTFPNWMTVNLSTVTALRNRTTPFWIWIESTNSNLAQITGDYAHFGAGHYFTYNGTSAQASTLYEFYIRVMAQQAVVGVDKETNLAPATYALYQNSPNPFNPETIISFSLAEKGMTRISIYNSLGEMVKELVNEEMEAGVHQLTFNAENLSSGIYFFRLEAGDFKAIKKMVLMR
jgi:hypothetical protein